MEERKQKEIEYYDKKAEEFSKDYNPPSASSQPAVGPLSDKKWLGDFEGFEPQNLESFRFCYNFLKENCRDKIILDYGCGNGIHSIPLAKFRAKKIIGIDLSEKSLKIARERVKRLGLEDKVEFILMDCEKMEFPDNYFDIIFDGGTFSSLDLNNVFPELVRVLKPGGKVIGIETFGHNPIANLKRKLNKVSGKRTEWAESHIFQKEDLKEAEKYFEKIEVCYFHIVSFLAIPFLKMPGGKIFLKAMEALDKILFLIPFLTKYAFKVIFTFSLPKK